MVKKRKKPESTRVPRTRNAGTLTESQFWGMIRATLRGKTRYWKPIAVTRKNARRPYKGENKRQKWEYKCSICNNYFPIKKTEIDHKIPVGRLACSDDLKGFIERLFVEKEGLQLVCMNCHSKKTRDEKKGRP